MSSTQPITAITPASTASLPVKSVGTKGDIDVLLIVHGPGVPKGGISEVVIAHIDLVPAATLSSAGVPTRKELRDMIVGD